VPVCSDQYRAVGSNPMQLRPGSLLIPQVDPCPTV
jgi:hypothetical protein